MLGGSRDVVRKFFDRLRLTTLLPSGREDGAAAPLGGRDLTAQEAQGVVGASMANLPGGHVPGSQMRCSQPSRIQLRLGLRRYGLGLRGLGFRGLGFRGPTCLKPL